MCCLTGQLSASLTHAASPVGTPLQVGKPTTPPDSKLVVVVSVVAEQADADALEATLVELLGRLDVGLRLSRVDELDTPSGKPSPADSGTLARVWVDLNLHQPKAVSVVIEDARSAKVATRRELTVTAPKAVLLEQVAHMIHATIESLLHAEPVAPPAPPEPPEPPEPVPPQPVPPPVAPPAVKTKATPAEPPSWGLDAAPLVGLHVHSDHSGAVIGMGGAMAVGYRRGLLRPTGWLTAEYRLAFDTDEGGAPPQAHTLALRLFPTIDIFRFPMVALHVGVGAGLDVFFVEHRIEDSRGHGKRDKATHLSPVIIGGLITRVRIVDNVQFIGAVAADFDLHTPTLEVPRSTRGASEPWIVRPAIMLGLSFSLAGSGPFYEKPIGTRASPNSPSSAAAPRIPSTRKED